MNIAQFCKEFNDRTKHIVTGVPIPTIIHYKVIINAINIYKSDRDTRGKIKMKPLRETNVGVAEA